jgi:threonine-phosphate decarboxylase
VVRALRPRRALIAVPAFSEYERALQLADVPAAFYETSEADGFALRRPLLPEEIREAGGEDCDAVFLANPTSPSGVLLKSEELRPIVESFLDAGLWVILDEAFVDFDERASLKHIAADHPRLVILRSFTKFFGIPGIRLGYSVAAGETIEQLAKYREPWSVNTIAQEMGRACLIDETFIRRTRMSVHVERDYLITNLAKVRNLEVFDSKVNYLLVKLTREGWTSARLRREMMQRGILIRDAGNFRGLDDRYVRLAVRLRSENDRLLAALKYVYEG